MFRKLALVFVLVAAAFYGAAAFIDPARYQGDIEQVIEQSLGLNVEINGQSYIRVFPYPTYVLTNVTVPSVDPAYQRDVVSVGMITLKMNPLWFIGSSVGTSAAELHNAQFNFIELAGERKNWSVMPGQGSGGAEKGKVNFILDKAMLNYYSEASDITVSLENMSGSVSVDSADHSLELDTTLTWKDMPYQLVGDISFDAGRREVDLTLSAPLVSVNVEASDDDGELAGEFTISGKNLPALIAGDSDLLYATDAAEKESQSDDFMPEGISLPGGHEGVVPADEVPPDQNTANNTSGLGFKVSGSIASKAGIFRIEGVKIESDLVKGSARFSSKPGKTLVTEGEIKIEQMDLDTILSASRNDRFSYTDIVLPNITLLLDLQADNIRYHGGAIQQVNGDIQLTGGALALHPLTAFLPGQSAIEIQGTYSRMIIKDEQMNPGDIGEGDNAMSEAISSNPLGARIGNEQDGMISSLTSRPTFIGDLSAISEDTGALVQWLGVDVSQVKKGALKNLEMRSKLIMMPHKTQLSEIRMILDRSLVAGEMEWVHGGSRPKIHTRLRMNELNLDDYINLNSVHSYMSSTGAFTWLYGMPYDLHFDTKVGVLTFNGYPIRNVSTTMSIGPSTFQLENIRIRSDIADFRASIDVDVNQLEPKFKLDLDAWYFDTAFFDFDKQESGKKQTMIRTSQGKEKPLRWSTTPPVWLSIPNFDGAVTMKARTFKHKGLEFDNMVFNADVERGNIKIKECKSGLLGGTFEGGGTIITSGQPILALSFTAGNFKLGPVLNTLFGYDVIDGYASIGGSFETKGNNALDWMRNLNGTFNSAARGVSVKGIDLHYIIQNMLKVKPSDANVMIADKLQSGQTDFYNVDGGFQIQKGVITTEGLDMKSLYTSGTLTGSMLLPSWEMGLEQKFVFFAPDVNARASRRRAKEALAINLKYSGDISEPSRRIDYRLLSRYLQREYATKGQ